MSTTISGSNGIVFPDATSMQTGQQACKAWVNFNGVGTVAIRGSYNVSSITDNQTGAYTVNFITAMPNVDYSAVASGGAISGIGSRSAIACTDTPTTTSVGVTIVNTSTVLVDVTFTNVVVFSN